MTGDTGARRPTRRIALIVSMVATLALLCCGGGVGAFLLTPLGGDRNDPRFNRTSGCGANPISSDGELPSVTGWDADQLKNAAIIIEVGFQMDIPPRGWVVAIGTAIQESQLRNLGHLGRKNDHDSQGLFQQRPSQGWGTPAQVRDPRYSSRKFYEKLRTVRGWENMALTVAAQKVQRSRYPNAYAEHEPVAAALVDLLAGGASRVQLGAALGAGCAPEGEISSSGWTVPVRSPVGSGFRTASRPNHQGVDLSSGRGTVIRAVNSGTVTVVKCDNDARGHLDCDRDGHPGKGGCGWMVEIVHAERVMSRYCHLVRRPSVTVGQSVTAGQQIGHVGSSGNSSGPHLHFEIHLNNDRSRRGAVDPVLFMQQRSAPLGDRP
jgi:murein DD-endopeptidase MepM/ murein hydrolase activator NlpD